MDPGNWATDIAGGSKFGYTLLSVILISNLMAILLQSLCVRLGVATGRDLAQACRDYYSKPVSIALWILCEIAIVACDLAELLGSALALNLLFGIPMAVGVCLTTLDVLVLLLLQNKGFRYTEAIVVTLVATIAVCFGAQVLMSRPDWMGVAGGLVPTPQILANPEMLYIAMGILGATVMPHNLYLHSSIVQTRAWQGFGRGQAPGDQVRHDRFVGRAVAGVLRQRGDHGRRRRGRSIAPAASTSPTSATRTCCCRRCWAWPAPARCSRSRCSRRAGLDADGDARRPDRDGRLHSHPAAGVAAPAGDAPAGAGSRAHHDRVVSAKAAPAACSC